MGDYRYPFPQVEARTVYLWPKLRPRPYYYYGPYYPYPIYYGYPYSYGVSAYYNPYTGTYGRGVYGYGPYGGWGYGSRYNPATGTYGRGAAAWGPYQAGGWARHTSDQGADILCILNVHNDNAKYVFDRTQEGSYRLYGADGRVLAVTETIDELLAAIHVDSPPSGGGVRLKKAP